MAAEEKRQAKITGRRDALRASDPAVRPFSLDGAEALGRTVRRFTLTDTVIPNSLAYTRAGQDAFKLGAQAGDLCDTHPQGTLVS